MKVRCDLLFQELGNQITTVQEVVNEITNKRQIRRLVVLPYDLKIKDVFQENIQYSEYLTLLITSLSVTIKTYGGYTDLNGRVPPVHCS
jgi:RNA-binding protein NOB1